MSLEAYQRAQDITQTPREVEYRIFAKVTSALIDASDDGHDDLRGLIEAIHENRKLWTALATDCSDPSNTLPNETRAGIISLSMWVSKYSSTVMRDRASLEPLISLNKSIMTGLKAA